MFMPWPPWATRQEIETILSMSCHPRWPRQEQWRVSLVAIAGILMINFTSVTTALWTNTRINCTQLSEAKKKKVICTKFAPGVFVEIVEMKVVAESMIRLLMSSIYTIVNIGVRKKVSLVKVHLHNAENRAKLVGKKTEFLQQFKQMNLA
jgi:hypothetical protein